MSPTSTQPLDLNQAFHLMHKLGMTRSFSARATVTEGTYPARGVRAVLLLDFKTADSEPWLAGGYAIAAEYLFDGLSERQYQRLIGQAKGTHSIKTDIGCKQALLLAMELLVNSGHGVCIYRDDLVLEQIESQVKAPKPVPSEGLMAAIKAAPLYDGESTLATTCGQVTPTAIRNEVASTLAEGLTTYTEASIRQRQARGEHEGWRSARYQAVA